MIAPKFEYVAAVKDACGFGMDLVAGAEDLKEDGFEGAASALGFAFFPGSAAGGSFARGARELDGLGIRKEVRVYFVTEFGG